MSKINNIETLKIMLNQESIEEDILLTFLNIAEQIILNRMFPFGRKATSIPSEYSHIQLKIAAYMINKQGAEGQTAHGEAGINRAYASADIPEDMLVEIVPRGGFF